MGGRGRPSDVLTVASWWSSPGVVVRVLLSLHTAGDVGPVPRHSAHLLKHRVQSGDLGLHSQHRSEITDSHQDTEREWRLGLPSGDVFMARLDQHRKIPPNIESLHAV